MAVPTPVLTCDPGARSSPAPLELRTPTQEQEGRSPLGPASQGRDGPRRGAHLRQVREQVNTPLLSSTKHLLYIFSGQKQHSTRGGN